MASDTAESKKNLMNSNSKLESKRTLLIPHKRGLLPISSSSQNQSSSATKVQKTINPSALPAKIQLRRPVFSSLETRKEEKEKEKEEEYRSNNYSVVGLEEDSEAPVRIIEFDSSQAPQPFLEPELVLKIMEERQKNSKEGSTSGQGEEEDELAELSLTGQLSTEREVRRRAAQAEYGGMAIRDRMNVRGRRR